MKAAIYTRVSTASQAGPDAVSLEEQERIARDLCAREGWEIVEVYSDPGLSAMRDNIENRPAFGRLLDDAAAGRFGWVVCYAEDRLARNMDVFGEIARTLRRAGVKVRTEKEAIDFADRRDKLVFQIKGYQAEEEGARIKERTDSGKRGVARRGGFPVWQHLYAYKWDTSDLHRKRPVEVPEEAELVRLVFALADGPAQPTAHAIADEINKRGFRTRGGWLWYPSRVAGMLGDARYRGEWVVWRGNGEEFRAAPELTPPPLIDAAQWERVQRAKAYHRQRTRRPLKHTFLLNGVIYCEECGATMTGRAVSSSPEYRFYACIGAYGGKRVTGCPCKYVPAAPLEAQVWGLVEELAKNPEVAAEYAALTEQNELPGWRREARRLTRAIAKCESQLDRAMNHYERGDYTREEFLGRKAALTRDGEAWRERLAEVQGWIEGAEEKRAAVSRVSEIAATTLTGDLAKIDLQTKRTLLRQLDFRVTVGADDWQKPNREGRQYLVNVAWAGQAFLEREVAELKRLP